MFDRQTFDSRDLRFKCPYGAVPAGTQVSFSLRPPRAGGFSRGTLLARFEGRRNRTVRIPMPWTGLEGNRDLFTAVLPTEDYVGLIWYSFQLERLDEKNVTSEEHQLTVYDGSDEVPAWFGEGVTYQIFPDRFCRTCIPDPTGMVGGRSVHQSWEEDPAYRPDERGEIRNRDFFGGSLAGIQEKLPYLKSLGVETIYLCPIFEAPENHRYGTGDYEKIDPMLGSNEDFSALCQAAHAKGIRIILDGVFNHSAFVSKYFNGDGSYPSQVPGAAQSTQSPYYSWFSFHHWPDQYDAWWGIYSLPAFQELDPGYLDYIIRGENSIIRRWLRAGADGWRLDVADELPDATVNAIHQAVREEKKDGIVIGEVWEDGTTKIAYDVRRRHLLGGHCDGLMNYPFRTALLDYLLQRNAAQFQNTMETLRENYPPFAFHSAMNALGTHDTLRILTMLGVGSPCQDQSRDWRAAHRMTEEQRTLGTARLQLATLILYGFPGSPTLYYGDEAGMEGFEDPFNRRTYPWGREDQTLIRWFTALGQARSHLNSLRRGSVAFLRAEGPVLAFSRTLEEETSVIACNAGERTECVCLPWPVRDFLDGTVFPCRVPNKAVVPLPPMTGRLLIRI
ncbi:MAG: glycoside hydrolase family 13 protein [Oscillospiraceae bacterium]|nr:glycoside hydrolase family 13 protein [Oscillospiraceae bacterium]